MSNEVQELLEEVKALRAEVKELKDNKPLSKYETPWYEMTKYIEQQLDENISNDTAFKYKIKSALTSLIGKAFRKNNVMALEKEQCEEARKFVNFVITFMKENRIKSEKVNAPCGYERTPKYKQ